MKLAFTLFASAFGLDCWTCNAKSYSECSSTGVSKTCPLGEHEDLHKTWTCYIEESKRHGKQVDGVIMGCKQKEACINDNLANTDENYGWRKYINLVLWCFIYNLEFHYESPSSKLQLNALTTSARSPSADSVLSRLVSPT